MVLVSGRPAYAIVLLIIASLWLFALLLPLLYSAAFPSEDVQQFVISLEGRTTPPSGSASLVEQANTAFGPLERAIQVAHYSGATAKFALNRSHESETIKVSQFFYVAWFEKLSAPKFFVLTRYEGSGDKRAYNVASFDPMILAWNYLPPLLLFGVSLFLMRKRELSIAR